MKAGQCFSVGLKRLGINREYSIYSGENAPFLEFLIRRINGGAVSTALSLLSPGDEVEIGGPYGSFILSEEHQGRDLYFIASGTGIAPFASFVDSFTNLNFRLLHGIRHENERYEFQKYPPDRYLAAVSQPKGSPPARVTNLLSVMEFESQALFWICGNRQMITDAVGILRDRKVPGGSIYMETFF